MEVTEANFSVRQVLFSFTWLVNFSKSFTFLFQKCRMSREFFSLLKSQTFFSMKVSEAIASQNLLLIADV